MPSNSPKAKLLLDPRAVTEAQARPSHPVHGRVNTIAASAVTRDVTTLAAERKPVPVRTQSARHLD